MPNPMKNDGRKQRRKDMLGLNAACVICGETNPEALIKVSRTFLEEHHIAGKANDPSLTAILCRNCHAKVTAGQLDVGLNLTHGDRNLLERIIGLLKGLGVFLVKLGESLLSYAVKLENFVGAFDTHFPGWRELPEAQV